MTATLYAIANRAFESLGGLVTLGLIAAFFTPEQQGYYYTFVGLLTFQSLVDLGFGGVVQQFTSHEWAKGDRGSRLPSLVRFSFAWYTVVGAVVGFGLALGGSLYFRAFAGDGGGGEGALAWQAAWWPASLLTGAGMVVTPALAILEGTNQVERAYGTRLAQGLSSRIAGWLAIVSGLSLLTIPITRAASLIAGLAGMGRSGIRFLAERSGPIEETISWRREIWPLQWRIAVSSAGGYLLFSLFTPVLFASHGPELAGRMGMTLGVAVAISSAAFSFVATRVARLAILAARREFEVMDSVFRRAAASSLALACAGAASVCVLLYVFVPLRSRFLPLGETAILFSAMLLQQVRFAMGSYLRAHKQEPYVGLQAIEGLLAVAVLWPLGAVFGSLGMVTGFFLLTSATLVPAALIFERCRHAWHAESWVTAA